MSKSRVSPGFSLYQIVIQDFNHRKPAPVNMYVDKSGKGIREVVETIPLLTKLRWAKDGKRATKWGAKFGSVIACFKVDSHEHRLHMIEHLRLEPKPIVVDITAEEFTVGRDLTIRPAKKDKEIDVNGT